MGAGREFDVIVVGAGVSGGLPAAAYLQRAGASVLLVERQERSASFFSSYERAPGVHFDVSPVNFSTVSPALGDLDLAAHGYHVEAPDILYSTLDGAGRALTFFADPHASARQLAQYSRRDAAALLRLLGDLGAHARDILAAAFFTPDPERGRALELTAAATGIAAGELERLTAPEVIERLFESDAARVSLTALPAINLFGDLLAPGQGALAWLWTFLLRACRAPGGASSLPTAIERAFVAHGGEVRTRTAARRFLLDERETCRGVEVESEGRRERIVARHAVISNLGAAMTSELLGRELRPGWRSAGRTVFTADVVLDRPLAWESDAFRRSPRVYLLWDSWKRCIDWLHAAHEEREDVFLEHLELTQFSVPYGVGAGGAGLRVRLATGPFVDEAWDARRRRYEGAIRARLAALDPAVTIRSIDLSTPLDYWRRNLAARHGNPVGGDFVEGQWLGERLPYRSPVPGLYLSNAVWPTSLSWMAPGYNAACAVAQDLGIRDQPWWSTPPLPEILNPDGRNA